jgi:hypothetical protein
MRSRASALILAALAAVVVALTLYAYRELAARPFAADDYQWLLNVRDLSFGQLVRQAFDPSAQSHFYRPLVWLLFWAQTRVFGLDPRGFHAISLGLHLLNAGLLGWLAYRLTKDEGSRTKDGLTAISSVVFGLWSALLAAAIVALHPAPFEAIVWVSAQSELLAASLLLAALLLWLCRRRTNHEGPIDDSLTGGRLWSLVFRPWSIWASLALGLALLAKESAVIGLPLLFLLGRTGPQRSNLQTFKSSTLQRLAPYLLPTLITLAYVGLQVTIERRNYLLEQGGYGFGPQLLLNPLRSLALIVAPLPGTEHADAAWLIPVGALIAFLLLIFWISGFGLGQLSQFKIANPKSRLVIALALTLLPTAPFVSPPDSRYLYLPVMAAALLIALWMDEGRRTKDEGQPSRASSPSSFVVRLSSLLLILGIVWAAQGELHEREWRFAAASGPGGSLWRLASAVCAESRPERMVLVEPPLAPPHAEAIVGLSCGEDTRARIVGRDQIDKAIKGHSVVIAFPNGSAQVERWT